MVLSTRLGGSSSSAQQRPADVSTAPGGFVLPRLDGRGEVRLRDLRGRPAVVDLFASWCTACEGELPGFARVATALGGRVTFVGVDSLETGDGLAMARRFGLTAWPLAQDVDGRQGSGLHDNLGARGMPATAFYDASGHLLAVEQGALPESQLRARISELFHIHT